MFFYASHCLVMAIGTLLAAIELVHPFLWAEKGVATRRYARMMGVVGTTAFGSKLTSLLVWGEVPGQTQPLWFTILVTASMATMIFMIVCVIGKKMQLRQREFQD